MATIDPINLAIETMGEAKEDDYIIAPTQHAKEFKDKAPDLAAILRLSEVNVTAKQFETYDKDALDAQKEFKHVFARANKMVLITAILIALVLVTGTVADLLPETLERVLLIVLSVGSVITGALASKDLSVIKQGKLLDAWMSKRAAAETARLNYFYTVAKSPAETAAGVIPLELLKLEYFRRFQLDVQLNFYRKRAKDHNADAKRTLSYSSWAVAGAAIATGIAGVLGVLNAKFAAIASVGTILTAFSSFATMRAEVYQNQRNAERYTRTYQTLEELSKRLSEVRRAVLTTGADPLIAFIDAVHEQLSLEHRQWIGEQGEAQGLIAKLEETLKDSSKALKKS